LTLNPKKKRKKEKTEKRISSAVLTPQKNEKKERERERERISSSPVRPRLVITLERCGD